MNKPAAIDFYFDFSSPYGYLMSEKIDDLAARHGRAVRWRPVLLGPILKVTGAMPLAQAPLKGDYSRRDVVRSARFLDVPFALPVKFPIATLAAARAFYWLEDRDSVMARSFAGLVFRAYFTETRDIEDPAVVVELAAKVPLLASNQPGFANGDADFRRPAVGAGDMKSPAWGTPLTQALASAELKERLRAEVDAALARGVCGSPYVIIDGEPFLGVDRLPQIERWLANGGF